MLSVKNLIKTYQTKGSSEVKALDGVSIDFPETGMVFILGKSGSGKSTLLNIASGLDRPDGGEVIVNNKSSKDFTDNDFDGYRNKYVGFIFQEYNILEDLTVGANVSLALQLQGERNSADKVERILDKTGLSGLSKRKPNTLSGGQKQRVAIARALVKDPKVIFADEPSGALDSETSKDIFDTLKTLASDRLVVIVSHDKELATIYGDRIITLKDGKILHDTNAGLMTQSGADETPFIKSNLPLFRAIKIGASSLKKHKVRLSLTLLTSIIAFTMFAVVSTMMTYSTANTIGRAIYDSGYSAALMTKGYWYDFTAVGYDSERGDSNYEGEGHIGAFFGKTELDDINKMAKEENLSFAGVFMPKGLDSNDSLSFISNFDPHLYDNTYTPNNLIADYFSTGINWFTDCGENYMTKTFGNESLLAGRYPESADEIALSEYHYKTFEKYGFYMVRDESIENIHSPHDLIGKVLRLESNYVHNVTITGIYSVGNLPDYEELKAPKLNMSTQEELDYELLKKEFSNVVNDSFHTTAFVTEDFYDCYANILSKAKKESFNTSGNADLSIYKNEIMTKENNAILSFLVQDGLSVIPGVKTFFYADNESQQLSDNECLISISMFRSIANQLRNSIKIGENLSYGSMHPDFSEACDNLNRVRNDAFNKVDNFDIKIILNAFEKDWDDYVTVNYNNYQSWNTMYYGDENTPMKVAGVVYSENFSSANEFDFYVFSNINFVKANLTNYLYRMESRTTEYVRPSDERYSFIMSPTTTAVDVTNFIVEMGDRKADANASYFWENKLYEQAKQFGNTFNIYGLPFLIASLVLGLFAATLLFNYLSASIADRRKEIGILRALGARGQDVFKIFFSESAIICLICFVLSTVASALLCPFMDSLFMRSFFNFSIFYFGIINILLLLGVTLIVSFIGTFLPIWSAAKKTPIQTICL